MSALVVFVTTHTFMDLIAMVVLITTHISKIVLTMVFILCLIHNHDPLLQPNLGPPHHLPLLCPDPDLEMVLNHHIAPHNHLVLHLEVDQKKGLCLNQDLIVDLTLRLESIAWLLHLQDTLHFLGMKALSDHLRNLLAQTHVPSLIRKCLYLARIQTNSKMSLLLVGVSDATQKIIWVGIVQRLLLHAQ